MKIRRREFFAALHAGAMVSRLRGAEVSRSLVILTSDEAAEIKRKLPSASGRYAERAKTIRTLAQRELGRGPWSVTAHRPAGTKFELHDYFSEGPYFWPDPKNPNGPYIRKDGRRNPDRFNHNHDDLGAMSTAVLTLGMGSYFLDGAEYAEHAAKVLRVWFVDAATRMNPNLEHGQAIRGVNDGRGTGLIDTVSLIHCATGVLLLEAAGKLDAGLASGVRQWFGDFLRWMLTSDKGQKEGKSGNNHATWWTAQIAAYATLTGNAEVLKLAWERYRTYLAPEEIQPDGSCPREDARTNSLSYSNFNADAFATLCRIAQSSGVGLWDYKTAKGISYEKVVRYILPYTLDPAKWKKEQISPFKADSVVFPGLAGAGLGARDLVTAYLGLPRSEGAWVALVDLVVWKAA